ncbi:MAG: HAMP domain-containing sensor histidine kinase, partial [Armatimonadota bacterium]|nr:HAMP domain-containing sensor histidine kinase [Armatimonadota bacterium]
SFLLEVRQRGFAAGWELNVTAGDTPTTLHFAGSVVEGGILILGGKTAEDVVVLQRHMLAISNEQTNRLREVWRQQAETDRRQGERAGELYDEISRLNNELVNLQRELAKKNAELERLNQLKNQFLGMAAHDLRAPLGVIAAYSEFLLAAAGDRLDEEEAGFLETIRTSSEYMLRLVNDFLDVSSIEAGRLRLELEPVDLEALVCRNVKLNQVLAQRKQVRLSFRCTSGVPPLLADAGKIEQVLNNLIGNGVKFSRPGDEVLVELTHEKGAAVIAVRDRGPGIPADEQEKLFRPFEQTSVKTPRGEKGTGLGLAIVRRIVEAHRGRVWVHSEVGQGTTFFVSLPIEGG